MRFSSVLLLFQLLLAPSLALCQVQPPAVGEEEYRLAPDDVIRIQVWGRPDLTQEVVLDDSGGIRLPLVGRIEAAGRTTAELSRQLLERYRLLDTSIPEVMVTLVAYNSQSVTIMGEVRAPGRYAFRTMPDLWGAILAAGGATPQADLSRVEVLRRERPQDPLRSTTIDLSRGVADLPPEALAALRPKDTITVPSLVESETVGDKFQVLGSVRTPGMFRLAIAASVVEAIAASGGPLPDADLSKVRLTRQTSTGPVSYELDVLNHLYDGDPIADIELEAGDTVIVPSKDSLLESILNGFIRLAPVLSVAVSLTYLL